MQERRPLRQEAVEAALANPAARRILSKCIRKALPVKEISQSADTPLASTYRQVKSLVEEGVLIVERSAMTPDGKPYDLYRSRVKGASISVKADRVDVAWEMNAAVEDRIMHMWGQLGV